jgi:hypothetical protein
MAKDTEQLIEAIAQRVADWGLTIPALAFLEINKPLSFVFSQLALIGQPLLDVFVTHEQSTVWTTLLADRDQIEALIARLENASGHRGHSPASG